MRINTQTHTAGAQFVFVALIKWTFHLEAERYWIFYAKQAFIDKDTST